MADGGQNGSGGAAGWLRRSKGAVNLSRRHNLCYITYPYWLRHSQGPRSGRPAIWIQPPRRVAAGRGSIGIGEPRRTETCKSFQWTCKGLEGRRTQAGLRRVQLSFEAGLIS